MQFSTLLAKAVSKISFESEEDATKLSKDEAITSSELTGRWAGWSQLDFSASTFNESEQSKEGENFTRRFSNGKCRYGGSRSIGLSRIETLLPDGKRILESDIDRYCRLETAQHQPSAKTGWNPEDMRSSPTMRSIGEMSHNAALVEKGESPKEFPREPPAPANIFQAALEKYLLSYPPGTKGFRSLSLMWNKRWANILREIADDKEKAGEIYTGTQEAHEALENCKVAPTRGGVENQEIVEATLSEIERDSLRSFRFEKTNPKSFTQLSRSIATSIGGSMFQSVMKRNGKVAK